MISINFLLAMNRGNSRSAENHVENKKARLSSSTSSRTPDGHVHTFSDYLKTVLDNSPGSCKKIERQESHTNSCLVRAFKSRDGSLDHVGLTMAYEPIYNEIRYKTTKAEKDDFQTNLLTRSLVKLHLWRSKTVIAI